MKYVAWVSQTQLDKFGGATWTRPDGSEIVVTEVAEVPVDFDPNKVEVNEGFHDDDDFSIKVPCSNFPDLVYVGEVVKCVKGAPDDPDDFDAEINNWLLDEYSNMEDM